MNNLLIEIVTKNIPNNLIGLIIRTIDEKTRYQLNKYKAKSYELNIDSIKNHFIIYIKNLDYKKDFNKIEDMIKDLLKDIDFEYHFDGGISTFSKSIVYVKYFFNDINNVLSLNNKVLNIGDSLLNSSKIEDYDKTLLKNEIILKRERRKELFISNAKRLARENGCIIISNESIINDYVNKYNYPICIEGKFSEKYLTINKTILHTILMEQFNVLPLDFDNGNNSNIFIYAIEKNSNKNFELSKKIDEKFSEMQELMAKKSNKKLISYYNDLKYVTLPNNYGNLYMKTNRLKLISLELCKILEVGEETQKSVARLSILSEADRATEIVKVYPYLHGLIGKIYAEYDGENSIVSNGIYEYIKPRFRDDNIPDSIASKIVSISEKMEYITSYIISNNINNINNIRYNFKLRSKIFSVLTIVLKSKMDFNMDEFIAKILYVFLKDTGIVEYENIHSIIKNLILDVYRDECIKNNYKFYEFDMLNLKNFNIHKMYLVISSMHKINIKTQNKFINKLNSLMDVSCENLMFSNVSIDYNNLESYFENFVLTKDEKLCLYKKFFKKIFNI